MIGKIKIKKSVTFSLLLLIIIMSSNISVRAEEESIRLNIDSLTLQLGSSVNMTLTVPNMNGAFLKELDGIENFEILSRGQSSSTSIINGKTTRLVQVNYVLMPKTTGDFQLTAYIDYKDKTYKSNTLNVKVSEASNDYGDETEDIFVKTVISKDKAYFGEKLVFTYELYSRYRLEDYGFIDNLGLDGFITKDIPREKLNSNYVTINGNKYIKHEVKKTLLTPTRVGTISIPSYKLQVLISTGDFFDRGKTMNLTTEPKEVTIEKLPADLQSGHFDGLVGQLDVQGIYNLDEVDYGQSLSLRVTLSGNSNIEIIDTIVPKDLQDFTVYETQKDLKEDIIGNSYMAQKEFEVILVPKRTGKITIDPISIRYFDVATGSYKDEIIPGKLITVKGSESMTSTTAEINTEQVKPAAIVINQINPTEQISGYFMIKKEYAYMILLIIILIIIIIIISIGVTIYYMKRRKGTVDKALRDIYNRTKKAETDKDYYEVLNDMIKYRYNISIKASSRHDIDRSIEDKTVVNHIYSMMDAVENRYRQEGSSNIDMKEHMKTIYKSIK
ncbi:BatD family protein [Wukongibacter sp. M2B1]|uniref:BatD family protein n=1 Tax=Wukongibacter sp. M2B1 TaxID=3088895 RepID=UPI003D79196D